MQTIERFISACRSHADHAYSLPDLVDASQDHLTKDFDDGLSPEQAVDAIAARLGLIHRDRWSLAEAKALINRIAAPRPTLTLIKR